MTAPIMQNNSAWQTHYNADKQALSTTTKGTGANSNSSDKDIATKVEGDTFGALNESDKATAQGKLDAAKNDLATMNNSDPGTAAAKKDLQALVDSAQLGYDEKFKPDTLTLQGDLKTAFASWGAATGQPAHTSDDLQSFADHELGTDIAGSPKLAQPLTDVKSAVDYVNSGASPSTGAGPSSTNSPIGEP